MAKSYEFSSSEWCPIILARSIVVPYISRAGKDFGSSCVFYMHIFLDLGASSVESIDEEAGLPEVGQLVQVAIVRRVS